MLALKRPSFQFYPGDWLRDTALLSCSVGARGLWIHMICLMHEGYPYGYLKVGDKVILPPNLARIVGATLLETEGWLAELESANVFSRDSEGCMFSRRMVRDENTRKLRAEGGSKGGNPNLKDNHKVSGKVGSKVNLHANLQPTPSSASSTPSSSASSKYIAPSNDDALADPPLFGVDTPPSQTPGLSGQADRQKTKATDKPPRKPNPTWDAICEVWGMKPDTKADATRIGKLARDYLAKGATLEEIRTRLDRCKRAWPNVAVVTPEALLKHWETFANEPERKHDNISRVDSDRPTQARVYVESPGFDPTAISSNGGPKQVVDENGRVYEEDPFGLHTRT
jgi:hypothetical protein